MDKHEILLRESKSSSMKKINDFKTAVNQLQLKHGLTNGLSKNVLHLYTDIAKQDPHLYLLV